MSTSAALSAGVSRRPKSDKPRRLPLLPVEMLLQEQRDLSAVERFAELHESGDVPDQARYYRDLIPLGPPGEGQQYAFEVDLDACTGCKACVAGCHSMNGLDPDEAFRSVGLLHGGTREEPELRTVTTSCHHCVEPACLSGCPVMAYEKDPITGIVKHLDDQCIGCQYCTLMCPYDAPKYSKSRGIVRKCDMCSDRLKVGEAPACVQACPNEAIAIRIVEQERAVQVSEANAFLPGAPAPDHTIPTTHYHTKQAVAHNLLPADFYRTNPEHAHPPLVIMLTLTQQAAGAFAIAYGLERASQMAPGSALAQAVFALAVAGLALGASLFHLGRPQYAWRAVLGLRTSWLSREAIGFGVFVKLCALYALSRATHLLPPLPGVDLLPEFSPAIGAATAALGLAGVYFSVMVYSATKRAHWRGSLTGLRFFSTTILLGAASCYAVASATSPGGFAHAKALLALVMGAAACKLLFEASLLFARRGRQHTVEKRMALLLTRELGMLSFFRFACGIGGGAVIPWVLFTAAHGTSLVGLASAMVLLLLAGELSERYSFFAAAPASRMPGGLK
ncbi:MAG TPA: DmsC/YnfH family molybdoenzyme membrane anchor subunit [Polyangiaceae bacterium]|nr:DmsC/YnfH family molybdoenzyme membrane anchor subunit [Polyangiaceae bacterium]